MRLSPARLSPVLLTVLVATAALFGPSPGYSWLPAQRAVLSDPTAGGFGSSVAIDGRIAAVGAPLDDDASTSWTCDSGSVLLFERDTSGLDQWGFKTELHATAAACGDEFGTSIALEGDTLVVGARGRASYRGAGLVFRRTGPATWTQQAILLGSLSGSSDQCGTAVALSGDLAAVGCPDEWVDSLSTYSGAVYLFARNQGGPDAWGEIKRIIPATGDFDEFGAAVALSGSTLLVGSPSSYSLDGRATVHLASQGGANNWGLVTQLIPSDLSENDQFGASVALRGDSALIGAPNKQTGPADEPGAAYYFRSVGSVWSQTARLLANPPQDLSDAGSSVALAGGALLVGAYRYDLGETATGAALLFDSASPLTDAGPPPTWLSNEEFVAGSTEALDRFGYALASTPCHAVITSIFNVSSSNDDAGLAYVFESGLFCDDFESGSAARWD